MNRMHPVLSKVWLPIILKSSTIIARNISRLASRVQVLRTSNYQRMCYKLVSKLVSNKAMKPSSLYQRILIQNIRNMPQRTSIFSKAGNVKFGKVRKYFFLKTATGCNKENAMRASFEASQLIAKTRKLCTIAEVLILFAAKNMISVLINEQAAKEISIISLSNDTVKRQIDHSSTNIKENWIRDTFSVNVYELEGLRAEEKDKLIEISTDGSLKL